MKFTSLLRLAGAIALAGMVVACSGGAQVAPRAGVSAQTQLRPALSRGANDFEDAQEPKPTPTPMLYVADSAANAVYGYLQAGTNQAPVITLKKGLSTPYGLFLDKAGNLYVANYSANNVVMFPPGQTKPSKTYRDNGEFPVNSALCPDGTFFVANQTGSHGGITVYANGSTFPTNYLSNPNWQQVNGVACDKSANVYVSYIYSYAGPAGVDEYGPGGTGSGTTLPLSGYPAYSNDMVLTMKGDVVITDVGAPPVKIEFFHPSGTSPYKTFSSMFNSNASPFDLAYNKSYAYLYVSDQGNKAVYELNASTGSIVDTIKKPGFKGVTGVATFPGGHY